MQKDEYKIQVQSITNANAARFHLMLYASATPSMQDSSGQEQRNRNADAKDATNAYISNISRTLTFR